MENGIKEMIAISDGERESKNSRKGFLLKAKDRGLNGAPKLALADSTLEFWATIEEVFPSGGGQRCWGHKTGNVLDKVPDKQQPKAKEAIREIYMAITQGEPFDRFIHLYSLKYEKACECL